MHTKLNTTKTVTFTKFVIQFSNLVITLGRKFKFERLNTTFKHNYTQNYKSMNI